ncbi:chemotaxis protein CheD [Jeotgalibaca dankookensis]|uniref:chemotaxis protein CheD n=1 Tax=Jeotgalibaca dankookensis TaxID=708126 RepID=UPI000784FC59|nr:chemotaxis protein CheD [Jeotgalibaca dankookensis]
MEDSIRVGIGEYKSSRDPQSLMTIALGSCVGIALYEPNTKVGGLSHIMLPDSTVFHGDKKIGKFADLAIPSLVTEMEALGAKGPLTAKIAGGASMFKGRKMEPHMQIGQRNLEAVREILAAMNIPIVAEHTGDHIGRSMKFDLYEFSVCIRTATREYIKL